MGAPQGFEGGASTPRDSQLVASRVPPNPQTHRMPAPKATLASAVAFVNEGVSALPTHGGEGSSRWRCHTRAAHGHSTLCRLPLIWNRSENEDNVFVKERLLPPPQRLTVGERGPDRKTEAKPGGRSRHPPAWICPPRTSTRHLSAPPPRARAAAHTSLPRPGVGEGHATLLRLTGSSRVPVWVP